LLLSCDQDQTIFNQPDPLKMSNSRAPKINGIDLVVLLEQLRHECATKIKLSKELIKILSMHEYFSDENIARYSGVEPNTSKRIKDLVAFQNKLKKMYNFHLFLKSKDQVLLALQFSCSPPTIQHACLYF
jgi:hypothetical protein